MSQNMKNPQPRTWVRLKGHDHEQDTAKSYCQFIERFYWRPRDEEPNELHIVFNSQKQYKYFDVPERVFERLWNIAHHPSDFDQNFGSIFRSEIKGNYEFDKN